MFLHPILMIGAARDGPGPQADCGASGQCQHADPAREIPDDFQHQKLTPAISFRCMLTWNTAEVKVPMVTARVYRRIVAVFKV